MERQEMLSAVYGSGGEDSRLVNSRHGQLEYLTTMHYMCARAYGRTCTPSWLTTT